MKLPFVAVTNILLLGFLSSPMLSEMSSSTVNVDDLRSAYTRPVEIPFPEDNPYSEEKEKLGKLLFFDPRLSRENNLSCASCHNPSFGWEDNQKTSVGTPMSRLGRHTPTILNLAWGELFFWDGRAGSLEEQALGPIGAEGEMAQDMVALIGELNEIEGYRSLFEEAFPGEGITPENIGKAIATYERTIVSEKAPFDLWVQGDDDAIPSSAKRGFVLFNTKAKCASCHDGWNFTDWGFYNIGLPGNDKGRFEVLDIAALKYTFKTPGLRNIAERTPYMHDGSLKTLMDVVDHYNDGFVQGETLADDIVPLGLTQEEKEDLVAFMLTLSSDDKPITLPKLPQ